MKLYIRNRNGNNQRAIDCYSWTYCNDNDHGSTFDCFGDLDGYDGGVVLVPFPETGGKHVSLIKTLTPGENGETVKITTDPFINYFDRSVKWNYSADNVGETVTAIISDNWINQSDEMYRAPWLSIDITTSGSFTAPELDDTGSFNVKAFLQSLQNAGRLYLGAVPINGGILLTDDIDDSGIINLFIGVGDNQIVSETYSDSVTAKITNIVEETETDYYLFDDGTFSPDPTAGTRVYGRWEKLKNATDEEIADTFAKNKFEHKITFWSTLNKRAGANVRLRMEDGRVINTVITCVKMQSTDNRIRYECGRLKTTLTDFIGGLNNGK